MLTGPDGATQRLTDDRMGVRCRLVAGRPTIVVLTTRRGDKDLICRAGQRPHPAHDRPALDRHGRLSGMATDNAAVVVQGPTDPAT